MRRAAILLALAGLQGCAVLAPPEDWSRADTIAEVTWQALNVIDGFQTADIQNHPRIHENDWLSAKALGRQPSTSGTWQLMATYALSHYLISKSLPAKWRPYWHVPMLIGKADAVIGNRELGLR